MRIIKKYPNRRLYDTALRTYITLDDVKQLVFNHIDFQVMDAKSKKDLTQTTLLQIITEQETTGTPIFTIPLLQSFIRFYPEKSQSIVSQYLEEMLQLFTEQKKFFEIEWSHYQKLLMDPLFIAEAMKLKKKTVLSSNKKEAVPKKKITSHKLKKLV